MLSPCNLHRIRLKSKFLYSCRDYLESWPRRHGKQRSWWEHTRPGRSWRWWEQWCSTPLVDKRGSTFVVVIIILYVSQELKVTAYQSGWRRGQCRRSERNHAEAHCSCHNPLQTHWALGRCCPYREPRMTTTLINLMIPRLWQVWHQNVALTSFRCFGTRIRPGWIKPRSFFII